MIYFRSLTSVLLTTALSTYCMGMENKQKQVEFQNKVHTETNSPQFGTMTLTSEESQRFENIHNYMAPEIILHIFKNLPRLQMDVRFVSKNWLDAAKLKGTNDPFADYNIFQETYLSCIENLDVNLNFDTACQAMRDLRRAHNSLGEKGWSLEEQKQIADTFLKNNTSLTHVLCNKHNLSCEASPKIMIDTKKSQKEFSQGFLWAQLAILRLYSCCFKIEVSPITEFVFETALKASVIHKDYAFWLATKASLNIIKESEKLAKYHSNFRITDFERNYAVAIELYERDEYYVNNILSSITLAESSEDWEMARKLYTVASTKNPQILAYGYYMRAGLKYARLKKLEMALELCTIAFTKNQNLDGPSYAEAGFIYLNLKNYEKAAELYTTAFTKDPTLRSIHFSNAGLSYIKLENYEKAAELYTFVTSQGIPLEHLPSGDAGYCYAKIGDTVNASHYFQEYIKFSGSKKIGLSPDTLRIIETVLTETNADEHYLQWVHSQQEKPEPLVVSESGDA